MPNRQPLDSIFGPPMPRWKRGLWHTWFAVRHPLKAAVAGVSLIPAVRRHVLFTTPLSAHPMYGVADRAAERFTRALHGEEAP